MAWHLWYVHAMIITILTISVSLKLRIKSTKRLLLALWLFSILFFVLRWITDSSNMWYNEILQNLYMCNYQNALFTGLPIFLTGMVVAATSDKIKYNLITFMASVLLLTASYSLFLHEFPVFVVVSSFAMLLMILSVNIKISFDTIMIRELSKYVFFLHLIFVFLLRGHIIDVYLFWITVTAFTLLSSILLIWTKRKFNISAI